MNYTRITHKLLFMDNSWFIHGHSCCAAGKKTLNVNGREWFFF